MERYADFIIKRRKLVVAVFIALAVFCVVMLLGVKVNYNMVDYLPRTAQSTTAVEIMTGEFTQTVPNASVMVRDLSIVEALAYKEKLAAVNGVGEVLWLDDMVDVNSPLIIYDADTVEGFYKGGNALFSVSIQDGYEAGAVNGIRALVGERGAVSGEAVDGASMQDTTISEVLRAAIILLPAILLILVFSTTSWIEPLLFLAAIGVSIIMNMGTNLIFGEISFVTNAVGPILQLAVSLDYAIFLLHSFAGFRERCGSAEDAMKQAIKKSVRTVAASAVTTLFGFIALAFMDFGIGADLGLTLAKGILLSFVSCMVFLPALTVCALRAIDKSRHRDLMPGFKNVNRVFSRIAIPAMTVVVLLALPAFLGQARVDFLYGNSEATTERGARDARAIEDEFGKTNVMAILVPRGDVVKEYALSRALEGVNHVTGVMSYANTVGAVIPPGFLEEDITGQFYSAHYARIIVYTDTEYEGDLAFSTVEAIDGAVARYYAPGTFYAAGQSANLYDMKNVVAKDNTRVNLIAIVSIFMVLIVTFISATLPFVLLFTIEAGIWINLSIPYFMGEPINFLGYLVINTVQLGATVDYAILLTSYYMDNRRQMPAKEAVHRSLGETFKSILMSAATLSIAGFTLGLTSSNPSVSSLGLLLGRGTILSFIMVVCMLPALLRVLDKPIRVTTYKAGFFSKSKRS
ncbi:MAG: MMPL family transporter [Clostridiales bacterium]|jgi:predicted RND superfamily exporter protein|nr:MMPL family transporter [Clostridiales bacterium]